MSRLLLLALVLVPALATAQPVPDHVVLVSGDTLRGEVDIREPFLRSAYVLIDDSTRYRFSEVLEVRDGSEHYALTHGGLLEATTMYRRVEEGRISLYAKVSGPDAGGLVSGASDLPSHTPSGSRYAYFRKDSAPVLPVSVPHLRDAMRDSPAALSLLEERRRLGFGQFALGMAGMVSFAHGLTRGAEGRFSETSSLLNTRVILGGGLLLASLIPRARRKALVSEAIEVYNAGS